MKVQSEREQIVEKSAASNFGNVLTRSLKKWENEDRHNKPEVLAACTRNFLECFSQ